jgi:hypothetical protein
VCRTMGPLGQCNHHCSIIHSVVWEGPKYDIFGEGVSRMIEASGTFLKERGMNGTVGISSFFKETCYLRLKLGF